MLRRLALAGMVVVLVGGTPFAQTREAAQDDFIESLRTRANAGDADAQFSLGDTTPPHAELPPRFWRNPDEMRA